MNRSKWGLNIIQLISNIYGGFFLQYSIVQSSYHHMYAGKDVMVTSSLPRGKNQTGLAPLITDPPPIRLEARNSCAYSLSDSSTLSVSTLLSVSSSLSVSSHFPNRLLRCLPAPLSFQPIQGNYELTFPQFDLSIQVISHFSAICPAPNMAPASAPAPTSSPSPAPAPSRAPAFAPAPCLVFPELGRRHVQVDVFLGSEELLTPGRKKVRLKIN